MCVYRAEHEEEMSGKSSLPVVARREREDPRQRGISLIELLIAVIVILTLASMAIPSAMTLTRSFRIGGDARVISAQLNVARMSAAAGFTHARLYVDLTGNTYHMEVWNKAGDSTHTSGCWQTDGDKNACTQTTSPVSPLASGDTFGYGSITTGPTAATSSIAQAPACTSGVAGTSPGSTISNTACVEFNSRSYPVTSANQIVASDAIYLTNNQQFYSAIALSITGQTATYRYGGSAWTQF